jgi:hypothetical protein
VDQLWWSISSADEKPTMISKYDKRILISSDDVIKSPQEITPFLKNNLDGNLTDRVSLDPALAAAKRVVGSSGVTPGEEYFNNWVTDRQIIGQPMPSIESARQCPMVPVTCS